MWLDLHLAVRESSVSHRTSFGRRRRVFFFLFAYVVSNVYFLFRPQIRPSVLLPVCRWDLQTRRKGMLPVCCWCVCVVSDSLLICMLARTWFPKYAGVCWLGTFSFEFLFFRHSSVTSSRLPFSRNGCPLSACSSCILKIDWNLSMSNVVAKVPAQLGEKREPRVHLSSD